MDPAVGLGKVREEGTICASRPVLSSDFLEAPLQRSGYGGGEGVEWGSWEPSEKTEAELNLRKRQRRVLFPVGRERGSHV